MKFAEITSLSHYAFYEALAVSGNRIIVAGTGCESASEPGGIVYALNASTGAVLWSRGGVIDDAVKVGSYVITAGSDATGYYASVLNLSDGTTVWSADAGCDQEIGPDPALVVGLTVMTYGCDSQNNTTVEAHNLATGALTWSRSGFWALQRGDLSGSAGKHLYVRNPSGTVVSLNPLTGKKQYSISNAVKVLAVDASRVYATCGSQGQYVCAYTISTGAFEWQNTQAGSPALAAEAAGVLYLDSGAALNAATGHLIRTLNYSASALAVGDGRIAAVSETDHRVLDLYGLPGH